MASSSTSTATSTPFALELLPHPPTPAAKSPLASITTRQSTNRSHDEENSPVGDQPPEGATVFERPNVSEVKGRLIAANFAVFLAGLSDASTGALIPYLQDAYDVGLLFVALIYLTNFAGWLVAAFTNVHLTARIGMGGAFVFGAFMQMAAYCIMFWKPPYPVFVCSFFFCGLGLAYQDAQANVFVANVNNAHRWLGLLHSLYGAGALISPLIATLIASKTPYWHYFYVVVLGLAAFNLGLLSWNFRKDLKGTAAARDSASKDLKSALKERSVIILSLFFFLYVGAEVTAGGWVVEFLIRVRGGKASEVGYVASGFWGGLTVGRLVLADITHRFGERRMVMFYVLLSVVVQLIFWFVPSLVTSAVMISLLGFLLGPLFPTGISVLTKLLPRELHTAAVSFSATMGQAGSAAFPFMTGAIAAGSGVGVLQPVLVGLLAGMAGLWVLLPRTRRPTV
ncbi:uncharacterized protein H6S33_010393 [Morchella sextelata]|uniref:uncharacterized protein n=1 Tax=Morchella sextelata TaxID=1174677 RepID=UPI001D038FBD|nr:uncharacterized protein H6S33_010393 [Morchella sextelata]KAH0612341.1 hypothetical protein H6S33_010393 [Morchella sextelata]